MARVLIVEDEFLIAMSLEYSLHEAGHEVLSAHNGRKALELLHNHAVDVIVTDYMMPRMDGSELISRLRQEPRTAGIKIVLSTALSPPLLDGKVVGYDAYLQKPVREDELVTVVARLLEPS
jgi:CheY-like chemotaxis protein